jgi:gluconolactonase
MHPLIVYHSSLGDCIHKDFELELLDDSCLFAEGPVWSEKGYYLFSDISSNVINKIVPGSSKEVYLSHSGCDDEAHAELPRMMGSNGLAYDQEGSLLVCRHGTHDVARYDGKTLAAYINTYNNKPLNSPNDIVVHSNGQVFFSDPPYGLKDQKLNADKHQPHAGAYCWREGRLELIWDKMSYPNGVCLSPDERSLFLCSNKPFEATVLEFDVKTLQMVRVVCQANSDGIKCDQRGNLFLCTGEGILIINPGGEKLGLIRLPTIPANICWGGKDLCDLFITARQNIFLIPNLQKAV